MDFAQPIIFWLRPLTAIVCMLGAFATYWRHKEIGMLLVSFGFAVQSLGSAFALSYLFGFGPEFHPAFVIVSAVRECVTLGLLCTGWFILARRRKKDA